MRKNQPLPESWVRGTMKNVKLVLPDFWIATRLRLHEDSRCEHILVSFEGPVPATAKPMSLEIMRRFTSLGMIAIRGDAHRILVPINADNAKLRIQECVKEEVLDRVSGDTMEAFADMNRDANVPVESMCHYRAVWPVTVNDAIRIFTKALGISSPTEEGYNTFRPASLIYLPHGTKVYLAREYSPCVYVDIPDNARKTFNEAVARTLLGVDEFHSEKQFNNTIRLWWD